jgi:hypothetical protein
MAAGVNGLLTVNVAVSKEGIIVNGLEDVNAPRLR